MRAFKPQDRFQRFQHRPGAENGPAGLRGPKGVDRGKAAEEPGGEPARRGEPPLRMPLCGPRTPPCGPSSPQHPFGIRRGAENGPAGLWEPKGVQTAGSPRPQEDPETDLACGRGKTSAPDAPGRPLEPRRAIFRPRKVPKDGWTSKGAGKGVRSGNRGNRGDGLWAGPAAGKAARRPETSEKPRRRPEGGYIRRCPETGRTGPGRGENPRKSEAKRLNDIKTAVTLLVTSTALFRTRAPWVQTLAIFPHPGPRPGTPGDGRRPRRPRRKGGRPPGRAPPVPRPPASTSAGPRQPGRSARRPTAGTN